MDSADLQGHLEQLVGRTIPTVTGRPNSVLRIEGGDVFVGTNKSPGGEPVPIAEIQDAFDRLVNQGEVVVTPESVGYRSAFIGAALAALPGTEIARRPARVRLTGRQTQTRSPAWSYDELVLALDLYKREG